MSQEENKLVQYPESVKIDTSTTKGAVVTVHCYGKDPEETRKRAVDQYVKLVAELKAAGVKVAE